ncbi:MAG TPA: trypsin-like peptidase domain-containing protein [Gemmatimonadales bacterium]
MTGSVLRAALAAALAVQSPAAAWAQRSGAARSAAVSNSRRSAIVDAAARVGPAVVSVNVVGHQRQTVQDPFDLFFMPRNVERTVQSLGTGFVVSPDGVIITNAHVVENAEQIVVTTREGKDIQARLLGEDPLSDIAVLKVDVSGLPTVALGRSSDLMIGEWVVAIGNPYGYLLGNSEPSVSAGVVSAVGRNLLPSGDSPGVYVGMIQTDAAINQGNSGGPLVNALGEVIGVNSNMLSNSGGSVGLGFAIPIERALRVADEIKTHGFVRRAWTGLDVAGSEGLADWKRSGGLKVTGVTAGGPGEAAGVQPGDIMLKARGADIRTFLDWEAVKLDVSPGDTVRLTFRRAGADKAAVLVVQDLPTTRAEKVDVGDLRLVTVDQAVRQERNIRSPQGALVYAIGDTSQRRTGLQTGDVIFQIDRTRVSTAEDAMRMLKGGAGRPLRVFFERNGQGAYTDFYAR